MGLRITKAWTELRCRATALTAACASRLIRHEGGQDLIEYALMAAFIAVAVAAIFPQTLGPNISTVFSKVTSTLGAAGV